MLGIINRIIFGSHSPIIKIIEQRPHRQEEEQETANNHCRRPGFYWFNVRVSIQCFVQFSHLSIGLQNIHRVISPRSVAGNEIQLIKCALKTHPPSGERILLISSRATANKVRGDCQPVNACNFHVYGPWLGDSQLMLFAPLSKAHQIEAVNARQFINGHKTIFIIEFNFPISLLLFLFESLACMVGWTNTIKRTVKEITN